MPRIAESRKILNGRGSVVLYASGSSAGEFFYRELIKGTKRYKTRKIADVTNLDEAAAAAVEIAFEMNNEPDMSVIFPNKSESKDQVSIRDYYTGRVVNRRPRRKTIEESMDAWLLVEQERVDAGLISQGYLNARRNGLKNHVLSFLTSKMCLCTSDINANTFTDYPVYRSEATPIVRRQEIKWIKEWCKEYLVKNKYMLPELLMDRSFLPSVIIKQTDLLKNPAINSDDWKVIIDFVRDEWRMRPLTYVKRSGWFFRNMFWHFILFMKNTGMSPEEILKLKWKQIEIVDVGRINSKGEKVSWEVAFIRTIRSKTQKAREIPANQARELRRWKAWLEEHIKDKGINATIKRDSFVFGQPQYGWEPFCYKHISETWRDIRKELAEQLKGHPFSPHPYTVYSLRSSFAEDHLLKGTPVIEVAEMMGHSVIETQKTYVRLNLRKKGREITLPQMGNRLKGDGEVVDLFDSRD